MRFKQQFPFVLHLLLSRRNNWDIKDVSFSVLLWHVGWSSAEDTEPWNKKKENTSTPSTVYNGFNRKDQSSNSSKCHPIIDYTTVTKPSQAKMIVACPVKRLLRSPGFLCSLKDWQADTGPGERFSRKPPGGRRRLCIDSPQCLVSTLLLFVHPSSCFTVVYLTAFWTGYKLDSLPQIINQSA